MVIHASYSTRDPVCGLLTIFSGTFCICSFGRLPESCSLAKQPVQMKMKWPQLAAVIAGGDGDHSW